MANTEKPGKDLTITLPQQLFKNRSLLKICNNYLINKIYQVSITKKKLFYT